MFKSIKRYITRRRCISCGSTFCHQEFRLICPSCIKLIVPIDKKKGTKCRICNSYLYESSADICYSCLNQSYQFTKNTSIYYYNNPIIKELVHSLKFLSNTSAAYDISLLLKDKIQNYLSNKKYDIITITPISRKALRKRGFNQVALILNLCKVNFTEIFTRKEHKKHQSELTAEERKEKIIGQFELIKDKANLVKNKNVLLIDDIFTTGNTANEISGVLIKNLAKSVDVLTFFKD